MPNTEIAVDASMRILEAVYWFLFCGGLVLFSRLAARWLERRRR